ncbi:MAG TPA: glycosyltransferase [Pseudonocardia sp.]|nr:glycosyltransferase [Pseudonocardia sp.]
MPIAVLSGRAAPGQDGVADYTTHLVDALRDAGTDVEPVAVDPGPLGAARAVRRVRALRPELVHLQFAPSAFGFSPWIGLLPDAVSAPVVTTLHEYGWWSAPGWVPSAVWTPLERRWPVDRETWRLAPASAAVVTTNAAHAAAVAHRVDRLAVTIPLAPNVPDCGPVDVRAVRARLGIPADAQVVAFFGFVHPVKGLRYLIEAVARLRGRHPRLHLLLVGGFTSRALPAREAHAFRAELVERADGCGVTDIVTITDHLPADEVSAALHAADVAAFPFTAGATTKSGALLSAFAHGLPTLVTAADPPDPQLVDGATVAVADRVRDADALVGPLARLLDDAALRARVAAGGRALVAHRTWPRIAVAHQELYATVRNAQHAA